MASLLNVYVQFWQDLPVAAAQKDLEESIVNVYVHILRFLAQALHTYESSTLRRNFTALWSINDAVDFKKTANDLAVKVEFDASNCNRTLDAQGRIMVQRLLQSMQQMLAGLQQQYFDQL